jgi:hypothetical protein
MLKDFFEKKKQTGTYWEKDKFEWYSTGNNAIKPVIVYNSGPIQIIVCDNRIRQMNSFRSVKVNKTTDLSEYVVCRVEYCGGQTSYYAHQVLCHFSDRLDGKVSITLNLRKIIGVLAAKNSFLQNSRQGMK